MTAKKTQGDGTIAVNRRARFDYDITDTVEAGLVLTGTEVKSLRAARGTSIAEAFATVRRGEAWLVQATIPEYAFGNRTNHGPTRQRKLLLHRREIERLIGKIHQKGLTLVPTRVYFKGPHAKVELALARGKDVRDKRRDLKAKEQRREIERALRERY